VRTPIANLIRGQDGRGTIRVWLAELWPIPRDRLFPRHPVRPVFDILAGETVLSGQGLFSVLLIVALPIIDMALCRALVARRPGTETDGRVARVRGFVAAYESVFRRAIHIIVVVVGLLLFSRFWSLDPFAFAQQSMGGQDIELAPRNLHRAASFVHALGGGE
jgi:hypothetical protein